MEKPDFKVESLKAGHVINKDAYNAFTAGCEHVWNTYVVPLQERLNLEKESNHLLHGAMVSAESRGAKKGREEMESEIKALREEIEILKDQILEQGELDGN